MKPRQTLDAYSSLPDDVTPFRAAPPTDDEQRGLFRNDSAQRYPEVPQAMQLFSQPADEEEEVYSDYERPFKNYYFGYSEYNKKYSKLISYLTSIRQLGCY